MDAESWVAIGFLIFVGFLVFYAGVHTKLNGALDDRAKKIRGELDEAKRLREEAQAVLDSYKKKAAAAESEAAAIVAQAKTEAEAMAREAEVRMSEFVARRTKQAETKIALAETQATADVRSAAADAAVSIAAHVFQSQPAESGAAALVDQEIGRLKGKLN